MFGDLLLISCGLLFIVAAVVLAWYFGQKSIRRIVSRACRENVTIDMGDGSIVIISADRYAELLQGFERSMHLENDPKRDVISNPIGSDVIPKSTKIADVKKTAKKIEENLEKKQKRGN